MGRLAKISKYCVSRVVFAFSFALSHLIGIERIPFGQTIRPGSELGIRRDHAELLLVGKDRLAQVIPAFVEQVQVADLLDPLRRRGMGSMRAAWDVIEEERVLRRCGIQ